jgi:hypothetical protein
MYKTTVLNGCSKYDGLHLLGSNMSKFIGSIIASGHFTSLPTDSRRQSTNLQYRFDEGASNFRIRLTMQSTRAVYSSQTTRSMSKNSLDAILAGRTPAKSLERNDRTLNCSYYTTKKIIPASISLVCMNKIRTPVLIEVNNCQIRERQPFSFERWQLPKL